MTGDELLEYFNVAPLPDDWDWRDWKPLYETMVFEHDDEYYENLFLGDDNE